MNFTQSNKQASDSTNKAQKTETSKIILYENKMFNC